MTYRFDPDEDGPAPYVCRQCGAVDGEPCMSGCPLAEQEEDLNRDVDWDPVQEDEAEDNDIDF